MRYAAVVFAGVLAAGCFSSDPCPGQVDCGNGFCCPTDEPYFCNNTCYSAAGACGGSAVSCGGGSGTGPCGAGTYWDGTACQEDQYLRIVNDNGAWACVDQNTGSADCRLEFFSNMSGKIICQGGNPVIDTFTWQPGATTDSLTVSQNAYGFSMLSQIVAASTNATSFTAEMTLTAATHAHSCTLGSSTF